MRNRLDLCLVVAMCKGNRGIGIRNKLPWRIKADMKFFKEITMEANPGLRNAVIMGRKTWESIPEKMRPLKDRYNVILSRTMDTKSMHGYNNVEVLGDFESALACLSLKEDLGDVFVIGGTSVFEVALQHNFCQRIFVTEISNMFECDTFFPEFDEKRFIRTLGVHPSADSSMKREGDIEFSIRCYENQSLSEKENISPNKVVKVQKDFHPLTNINAKYEVSN